MLSNSDYQLDISASFTSGYDGNFRFSSDLSKINYEASQDAVHISYNIFFDKKKRRPKDITIGVDYYNETREDMAQSTMLSAKQLEISALFRSYIPIDQHSMINATIKPFYSFPLQTLITTNPNSVTAFTRNVVYTDYCYFNSKLAGANVGLSWLSNNLLKKNLLEFSLDVQYMTKLNTPVVTYEAGFVPDKYRLYTNAGIKLFF